MAFQSRRIGASIFDGLGRPSYDCFSNISGTTELRTRMLLGIHLNYVRSQQNLVEFTLKQSKNRNRLANAVGNTWQVLACKDLGFESRTGRKTGTLLNDHLSPLFSKPQINSECPMELHDLQSRGRGFESHHSYFLIVLGSVAQLVERETFRQILVVVDLWF